MNRYCLRKVEPQPYICLQCGSADYQCNIKSCLKSYAEGSPVAKKSRRSQKKSDHPIFDNCQLIQAEKAKLKMLKNTTQKRKAQIHRDIGSIAMTKDFDGAFEKALEYLTKSWKVFHYSKSQIFVQKFNFDNTSTFTRVFHPKFFLTIFLVKSKLSTAKKSKTTSFSRFLYPKKSTIFTGNNS